MNRSILLALLTAFIFITGCPDSNKPVKQGGDSIITRPAGADTAGLPHFIGSNAYNSVVTQVGFGPRNPNSEGHTKTLKYLIDELSKYTSNIVQQNWVHDGYDGEKLNLTNVIASFNPMATKRILLVTHWDTRPRGEQDPDSSQRMKPILGANDAGSGVGVLLELARVMKEHPPTIGIDLLLVDGEDYGKESDLDSYFLGARYFAHNLPPGFKPSFGVLLDMVGDRNAVFPMEANSMSYAPDVMRTIWDAAGELGLRQFKRIPGPRISDDHLPLNEGGIQTIDIIDADLVGNNTNDPNRKYWHTQSDTPDKVSAETLEAVGKLMVYMIYKLAPAAAGAPTP